MTVPQMIPANEFCLHHRIEVSFLQSLHHYGLIEITQAGDDCFFQSEELERVEKMIRLHYDLHINLEGLDAVEHLLAQIEQMQSEVTNLRNQLRLYEE